MEDKSHILWDILSHARSELLSGSDMGYTMPDGKYHIYIYPDSETNWAGATAETFFVVEPNRVINGAHEPMGDTFLTASRELSEVLIGCQWCMDVFEEDLRNQQMQAAKDSELPDELTVRLAHEAGWLEAEGKIEVSSWEDLQLAIQDAIRAYYEQPNEHNPFTIEESIERILLERFPSEPEPPKPMFKDLFLLTCSEESEYGINLNVSLHSSMDAAVAHADKVREEEDADPANWNFDVTEVTEDMSEFRDSSPEKVANILLYRAQQAAAKPRLQDLVQGAEKKATAQSHSSPNAPDRNAPRR